MCASIGEGGRELEQGLPIDPSVNQISDLYLCLSYSLAILLKPQRKRKNCSLLILCMLEELCNFALASNEDISLLNLLSTSMEFIT